MANPAGKYAHIITDLKPLPVADPSYQEKVDAAKRAITNRDPFRLAARYAALRRGTGPELTKEESDALVARLGKEGIKALASKCELLVKAHEQLLDASQAAKEPGWGTFGVKENAIRLPSGETIRIQKEPYGKVVDAEAFRLWCIANGYETKLHLAYMTMNAIVKERLLAGEAEPDGTEAFSYTEVQYVKAPKNAGAADGALAEVEEM